MMPPKSSSPATAHKLQELLFSAIMADNYALVEKRLSQGADPRGFGCGGTPLMLAAQRANHRLIQRLFPLSDIHATDKHGANAISMLVERLAFSQSPVDLEELRQSLALLFSTHTEDELRIDVANALAVSANAWFSNSLSFDDVANELYSISAGCPTLYDKLILLALAADEPGGSKRASFFLARHPSPTEFFSTCLPTKETPLHVAAGHIQLDALSEFSPIANLDARDVRGRTPLHVAAAIIAAEKIKSGCIETLLAYGSSGVSVDADGCDPLMLFLDSTLCHQEPSEAMRLLIRHSNLHARDSLGESAYDKALGRGWNDIATLIANEPSFCRPQVAAPAPASPPLLPTPKLQELLFFAMIHGDLSLVKKRLAQGADPRGRCSPELANNMNVSSSRRTPLMIAALHGTLDVIEFLLPLSDILDVDIHGDTALMIFLQHHTISSNEHLAAMSALFSEAVARKPNLAGHTPLMRASSTANTWPAVLDVLGSASDWMALDLLGNNILSRQSGRPASAEDDLAIWDAHPDPSWLASSINASGQSIAHISAERNATALLSAISNHANFAARSTAGLTPLLAACGHRSRQACGSEVIRLLAPWSNCRAVDLDGCDALMLVIENSVFEDDEFFLSVQELVGRCDLAARDLLGESAIDKALDRGFERAAEIIRARVAIFDERDELREAASLDSSPPSRSSVRI